MRKETTARLLLSLLTAFIMVAGALGAALPGLISQMDGEGSEKPSFIEGGAARELESKPSETGDAPVSADTGIMTSKLLTSREGISGIPMISEEQRGKINPIEEKKARDDKKSNEEPLESQIDADIGHGTRNPDTVDAGGPYGSGIPFNPRYEGDPITFTATIEPEDEQENYKFRWDWNDDGIFDGPGDASTDYFGGDGENTFTTTAYDDFKGQALVQAWDGSWTYVSVDGDVMHEQDSSVYWYWSGVEYVTWGWQFEVTKDSVVDKLGIYENLYGDPGTCLNMRIYDDTGVVIAQVLSPSLPGYSNWGWHNLLSPVNLYAGTTYTVSAYTYYSYTNYMPGLDEEYVDETDDGIVIPGDIVYAAGNNYPTGVLATYYPMVDFHYTATYAYPLVIEDRARVLVWNREPTVYNPTVSPTTTNEGEAGSMFSAELFDLGRDDEWEFQWAWGDGTESDWMPVPKWEGGIKVLLYHSITGYETEVMNTLSDLLDPNVLVFDEWDFLDTSLGGQGRPSLDYLLEYDVLIVPMNTAPTVGWTDDVGDILADYVDAGGGVVEMVACFCYNNPGAGYPWGLPGRWEDEGYSCFQRGGIGSSSTTSAIYDTTHPIIDGIAGTVSSWGTTIPISSPGAAADATLLADYPFYPAAAYKPEGTMKPGSGRIAGLNIFIPAGYRSGDAMMVTANAAFWASQGEPAKQLTLPIKLPEVSHIYKDDHPEHVTPSDQMQPRVRVRDDDHCRDQILGIPMVLDENFDGSWGPYGDNPPPGWTIEDHALQPWDYNDWHRYSYSTSYPSGTGTYAARVYYSPVENQDEWLITPSIDVSGYSSVTLGYTFYYYDYSSTTVDYGYVDVSFDGGAWSNIITYSQATYSGTPTFAITVPSGASTMQVRWRYVAYNEWYWFVDNVFVESGSTTLFSENFNGVWGTYGNNPPSGWTIEDHAISPWNTNDWHRSTFSSSSPGGTGTPAAYVYYYPYEQCNEWLISPEMDLTPGGYSTLNFQFDTWWDVYSTSTHEAFIKYRFDGGPWQVLDVYSGTTDVYGLQTYDVSSFVGHKVQIAFHWQCYSPTYSYNRYRWYVDNFLFQAIPELKHVYGMSDWVDGQPVTVANVFPSISVPEEIPEVVNENSHVTFEGIEITDPARGSGTEEFWYRYDPDDGTPVGPWIYNKPGVSKFRVLLYHGLASDGINSVMAAQVVDTLNSLPMVESVTAFNFYEGGSYPATPTLTEMLDNYDIIMFGCCYNLGGSPGDVLRTEFGDRLADWMDITGGGFISMMYAYGQAGVANEQWTLLGRYMDDDYGPYEKAIRLAGTLNLGNILEPSHPVMQGISSLGSGDRHDGMLAMTPGGLKLAEWTDGTPAIGVKELPNGARSVHLSAGGYVAVQGDYGIFLQNALLWAGERLLGEPCQTVEKTYLDNGVYNFDVQIIDDDMYWDWKPGDDQPTFVGPNNDPDNPGADPADWIAHNYIPIEVLNTDPVISPRIKAYAQLDLSLRMSGTKTHSATMTLYENGANIGYTEVTRVPGSPNIGVISNVNLMVTKDYEYEIEIVVDPAGGYGSNPTWLFDMIFPDGKFKEFKHTFNEEHGWTWTITSSELKGALLGHDIIFEAEADDIGSDDLAFVWNFGDSTPHGIHIFANLDQGTAVDAFSDEATVLFDQLPDRDDAFEKSANDVRTPYGTSIHAEDMISHVFDDSQPYYYYVMLTVMDDDVGDDYPSDQLNPCPGSDMAFLEVDFR